MNVGLCTISNKDREVDDIVALAGEVGYDGVEIWGKDHVGDGSRETCDAIRDAAEDAGVEIPVYGSYLRAAGDVDLDPDDAPAGTLDDAEIEEELEIADRLGTDLIRIWAGGHDYEDVGDAYWDAVVEDVDRIGATAEDYGIDVTVEKHTNTVTNSLEGARRLIEAVDRDAVGLNYQPHTRLGPEEIDAEAAELAPLSNHMHVLAVHERGTSDRYPYSRGDYDFEALLERFAAADYDGYVNVEFVSEELGYEEAVRADHDFVRSALERL